MRTPHRLRAMSVLIATLLVAAAPGVWANIPIATIPLNGQPSAAALNTTTNRLYIADSGTNTVLVFDTLAKVVVKCISVDADPVDIAVDEGSNRAFIACYGAGSLDVIDGASNTVTARVALGAGLQPNGVAWNPTAGLVYTADSVGNDLSVVDPAALTVNNVTFTATTVPGKVAVDPGTNLIYVTDTANQRVLQINGTTYSSTAIAANVPVPYALAIDTDTQHVYVCDLGLNQADVISETSGLITGPPISTGPQGYNIDAIIADPATDRFFFASAASGVIGVMDGSTNTVVTTLPLPGSAWGVAVNIGQLAGGTATGKIYGLSASTNALSTFDATSYLKIGFNFLGTVPVAMATNPATARAYVADSNLCQLSVIDSTANTVIATVPVGAGPAAVAVNQKTGMVYVADQQDNTLSVVDGSTNTVTATLPIGGAPSGVAVYDAFNLIVVANRSAGTLTLIDGFANIVT